MREGERERDWDFRELRRLCNDQGAFSHNYISHYLLKLRNLMTGPSFAEVVKIRLMQHAIRLQNECAIYKLHYKLEPLFRILRPR